MNDDRLREKDIVERLLDDSTDAGELEALGAGLRSLRAAATSEPAAADDRLAELFASGTPMPPEPLVRRWFQRPAVAFGAAFAGVLVLGAALVVINRDATDENVAAPTTPVETTAPAAAETVVAVPDAVGQSVGDYLRCVVGEVGGYLQRRVTDSQLLDRPRVLSVCGLPAIPPLGEEAEAFRVDLNGWLSCAAESFDAMLPELITDPTAIDDPLEECGGPPNPLDYGITFDFGDFDLRFLEDIELPEIDVDELFEQFRENLPDDLRLPEGFEAPDLDRLFEEFRKNLPEDIEGFEGFGGLDLRGFFEGFGDQLEGLDPDDLENLWRDLGDRLPELDGLFDGFLDRLPEDFEFGDLELWFNGEHLIGDEACEALRALGVIDVCGTAGPASTSA